MLTNYTSYDSVRTVLGVSSRIFDDTYLADEIYELALRAELDEIDPDLDQAYLDLIDESVDLAEAAQDFYNAMRLFAPHFVAKQSLAAMPEMSPVMVSDSKAMYKKDQAAVFQRIASATAKYRALLASAYAVYTGASAPATFNPNIAVASTPDFDPITGV